MTPETRFDILNKIRDDPSHHYFSFFVGFEDQMLMDCYLAHYATPDDYKRDCARRPEFLAVLATAEYHEHWSKRR